MNDREKKKEKNKKGRKDFKITWKMVLKSLNKEEVSCNECFESIWLRRNWERRIFRGPESHDMTYFYSVKQLSP